MKQYPADFRDRLLRALDAGLARLGWPLKKVRDRH